MRMKRRVGAGIAVVALSVGMTALGTSAANAAPPSATGHIAAPPIAGAGESCWYAVDTGAGLCVATGQDLVAAVAQQKGVRLVVPDGTTVSGVTVNSNREAALAPAGIQVSVALSTIYDDAGYGGGSYTMSVSGGNCAVAAYGFPDIGPLGWYNRVSSFRSYSGCKTAVFSSTGYGGASYGYVVNASSLGPMNDAAKSWRVSG